MPPWNNSRHKEVLALILKLVYALSAKEMNICLAIIVSDIVHQNTYWHVVGKDVTEPWNQFRETETCQQRRAITDFRQYAHMCSVWRGCSSSTSWSVFNMSLYFILLLQLSSCSLGCAQACMFCHMESLAIKNLGLENNTDLTPKQKDKPDRLVGKQCRTLCVYNGLRTEALFYPWNYSDRTDKNWRLCQVCQWWEHTFWRMGRSIVSMIKGTFDRNLSVPYLVTGCRASLPQS